MRRFKLFNILFSFCLFINLYAQEDDPRFSKEDYYRSEQNFEPSISYKYFRGKYLIYDCEYKHFVCVSELNFDLCSEQRKEAIDKRRVLLPCAPLKKLKNQIECFKLQYTLIEGQTYKGFCVSQERLD